MNNLDRQIKIAKKRLAELPKWMRDLMRFEGGDRTGLNQRTPAKGKAGVQP